MTRIVGRYVPVEMAVFGLLELLLSFVVIYALASVSGILGLHGIAPSAFNHYSANHAAVLAGTIGICAVAIGLYRPELWLDRRRLVLNAAVAAIVAFPIAFLLSGHFRAGLSRTYAMWLAEVLVLWLTVAVVTRSMFSFALRQKLFARRVLVLGAGRHATRTAEAIRVGRGKLFELAGLNFAADEAAAMTRIALRQNKIWAVVVAADAAPAAPREDSAGYQHLLDWRLRGVRVYDDVSFWEQHLGRINLSRIDASWFLRAEGFSNGLVSRAVKRVIDVFVSLVLLVLTLPLMLATAVAVRLDSPGPVLYRQQRVGLFGKPFTLLKFRSMRMDAEAEGSPRWAAMKDPRVTRVGSFIRSTRIDELPQLLNVLRGEMSLIGPRPERPHFVAQLTEVIPFYNERSYVKPGITGWAQVNFPYGASVEDAREKLSYDLYYVKNRGTFLDLLILIATVRVILFREGAR
jgi:sugar transferase (PEP-CTERM system associated)